MPLARVGARNDSTHALQLHREAWPISAHANSTRHNVVQYALRVLHFSAFHLSTAFAQT